MGQKIKILRQQAGVLPEDLAPIVDLTPPLLDRIEKGEVKPSVATLLKLSQYFNEPMEKFFSEKLLDKNLQVVRAGEQEKTDRKRASGAIATSYQFRSLAPNLKDKRMQPFFIELTPGLKEELPTLSHDGEEFLYVLSGKVEFHADKEVIELREGDSIYFHSNIPHALYAKGKAAAQCVVVVYPEKR